MSLCSTTRWRGTGGIPFEFIVVDDNSPDGTAGVVKELARRHPNVRCIHRIGRRGLSSAVTEGISASAAPYFAVIDADHQHDERILPQMLAKAWPATTSWWAPAMPATAAVGEGLSQDPRGRQPLRHAPLEPAHRQGTQRSDERLLPDAPRGVRRSRPDAEQGRLQDPARHHRLGRALPRAAMARR